MKPDEDIFRFTEAFGCGEILAPMLKSYLAHHSSVLHVLGFSEDLTDIPVDPRIRPVLIGQSPTLGLTRADVQEKYRSGHGGTAYAWSRLFVNLKSKGYRYVIHLDSDIIFLEEIVSKIENQFQNGFEIVGPRRRYRHSSTPQRGLKKIRFWLRVDAVDTHCFGFKLARLPRDVSILEKRINGGGRNRLLQRISPVIDFFDRVTFDCFPKDKIFYLDSTSQTKRLTQEEHQRNNTLRDVLIVFSAVGSGASFSKSSSSVTSHPYLNYALQSYALYAKSFLGIEVPNVEALRDGEIERKLSNLDLDTWTLRKLL